MKRTCVQCGKEFIISKSEIEFYKSKNLKFPKRCKDCRATNKGAGKSREGASETVIKKEAAPVRVETQADTAKKPAGKLGYAYGVVGALVLIILSYFCGYDLFGSHPVENINTGNVQETVMEYSLRFASEESRDQHFEKHGREMGFATPEEYEAAASAVVKNPNSLFKREQEDNDEVYYLEETNDFVIVSDKTGYIRTYYRPQGGIDYFNRQ